MTLTPDNLVYTALANLFGSEYVGPGSLVYHSELGQDPIPPYVTYQRVTTEDERTLSGELAMQLVTYSIQISSMFYEECAVDMSALDNWQETDSNSHIWYFNLSGQTISDDQFAIEYEMTACAGF